MAVTGKKVKSRLDFGEALDAALFDVDEGASKTLSEDHKPVEPIIAGHSTQDEEVNSNVEALHVEKSKSSQDPNINPNEPNNNFNQQEVYVQHETPTSNSNTYNTPHFTEEQVAPPSYDPPKKISDTPSSTKDAMFRSLMKNGRGVQRSVYFENDIFQYLETKAVEYDVKFSHIVNMLLREAINNLK